jgi:hypothetical protein
MWLIGFFSFSIFTVKLEGMHLRKLEALDADTHGSGFNCEIWARSML